MSIDWGKVAKAYWDEQPHPKAPSLKIGEFATAVKLATMTRFGGHATPEQAALFYPEFKSLGISPGEFEHAVERLAPVSFTYHGRPPTMQEIVRLKDEPPAKVTAYFGDLPDKHFPDVPASKMVQYLAAAVPYARKYLGREPVKLEARLLYHSGQPPDEYYRTLDEPSLVSEQGGGSALPSSDDRRGGIGSGRIIALQSQASGPQQYGPAPTGGLPTSGSNVRSSLDRERSSGRGI